MNRFASAGLAALALASCAKPPPPAAMERPPAPVSVIAAVAEDVPVYLDEIGKCVAREMVAIQPQISGQVTEIHFADGADVSTGDLLFTIDPRQFKATLDAAEATVAQQTAQLELAKSEFARVEGLLDTKAIARQDYDAKKNAVDVAQAEVKLAQAAVDKAALSLEYCSIRSPIDGRAGQRLVDRGNVVKENEQTLLIIQRLDPVYADFTVSENELSLVQRSMSLGTLRVEVRLPDDQGDPLGGELTFVDNNVQEATGTVKLRGTVRNPEHRLWPGQFVKVRLVLSTLQGAVLVPAGAPQMSANGPFLYVVKEDSTAELRQVTPGQRHGDRVVIESGLQAGERIITFGQIGVMPGAKVRVEEPGASAALPAKTPGNS